MLAVVIALLFILVIAVAVVLIVAMPQLRSGSEILTEDGKQAVARAGQVAKTGPIAVVDGTKSLLGSARGMVGQRGAPAESGPIPEVADDNAPDGAGKLDVVIDLRDPAADGGAKVSAERSESA